MRTKDSLNQRKLIGLYVHVPFCRRKCAYCDFASYAGREADIPRYVDAVVREITRRGAETGHPKADTIFLGGGTPSLLDEFQVTRILDALCEAFPMEEGAEITCECNPGTLTTPFAQALRTAGVNRLSMARASHADASLRSSAGSIIGKRWPLPWKLPVKRDSIISTWT